MRQKTRNENIKGRDQSKGGNMTSNIDDIDELLDDEGWDILNSLTEDELASLNSDFDPENMLIPTGERINHDRHTVGATKLAEVKADVPVKPMFNQKDLVKTMDSMFHRLQTGEKQVAPEINSTLDNVSQSADNPENMFNQKELIASLNKMVEVSQQSAVIKNDKIRQKDEDRKKKQKEDFAKKAKTEEDKKKNVEEIVLTNEEELLLADATEEELIEAAALLNMNDILTSDQINAVFAGDKPEGSMKSSVRGTAPKQARITKSDVETELDVVALNKNLKSDSDSLFFLCVNNQPLLERETLDLIIKSVGSSKKIKHLSLSMLGITDKHAIALSIAISNCTQLETLNLDSNIIGMPGIEALMNVIAAHPQLREIKCSNQKQPFGGQGEECMASAIVKNQNILKFGYSFRLAATRNKADRAIIKNNEILRQKRKNGEEAYDLKAVCKIRDPWPQPWIKVKGQRQLGSQLADKVTDMGLMIDVDMDTGRESRGTKVRDEREAKPLDIAALLAARASKLKGTNVGNLEKENEERRKKTLLAMKQSEEESGRVGTMMKKTPGVGEEDKPKESPTLEANEAAPPVKEEKPKEKEVKVEEKKVEVKKEEKPEIKKKEEEEEEEDSDEDEDEESDDEEENKKAEEEKKKREEAEKKKKAEEEKKKAEEEKKKAEEEEKKKVKIASLSQSDSSGPMRRKKKVDDEPEDIFASSTKKEEPKAEEKPLSASEERAKALRERREALAARKAGTDTKPEATEKPLSAADERAKALRERREALEAKRAGKPAEATPAPAPAPAAETPKVQLEEDKPLSLKERRALLAEKKRLLGK